MSDAYFKCPDVTHGDVVWASRLLGLPENALTGADGCDPRQEVLKSMTPMDIVACPGSGKTTLLVAKLAILAKKWPHKTQGICVLSHTNAARHEIESRLGNTAPGRRLLSYPHFVGTIHAFVNEFLAIPWLLSRGHCIKVIDDESVEVRRRRLLKRDQFGALKRFVKSKEAASGTNLIGKWRIASAQFLVHDDKNAPVFKNPVPSCSQLRRLCEYVFRDGYHRHCEMLMWAGVLLDEAPEVARILQRRFPLLFIDEAQDNSEAQAAILHRVFACWDKPVVRQRFGDPNQAVYGSVDATGATTDPFPNNEIAKKDLPNSYRFGQGIADLVDALGLDPYDLRGNGPSRPLESGSNNARHTVFLFDDDNMGNVLSAYGQLLIATFSDQELQEGNFTAIGQVHNPKHSERKPHHVGHYWPAYDPLLSRAEPVPGTMMAYILAGQAKSEATGEAHFAANKVADGILRLAGMATGGGAHRRRSRPHQYVLKMTDENPKVRKEYEELITTVAAERAAIAKDGWNGHWACIVREIAETISEAPLGSGEAKAFLQWEDTGIHAKPADSGAKSPDNVYRYSKAGRTVRIRIGSIHSAKGETHTATLVLETFWHKFNLNTILPWLDGSKTGKGSEGKRQRTRLKVHYVAMTRPTHLLCLAIKKSAIDSKKGLRDKLKARGWCIKDLTGT